MPTHLDRLCFELRADALRLRRGAADWLAARRGDAPPRLPDELAVDAPQDRFAFVLAENESPLWTQRSADEWPLTAGKVHNLRLAAARLDGLVVRAGQVFSFWHAVGRATRRRGFVAGRELREGCLVARTGGGMCQLSNALYAAALDAGAAIVERHAHSQLVPGSAAEQGRDATVFWNYLDLRFRLPVPFEIEARLDAQRLVVRLRGLSPLHRSRAMLPLLPWRGGPCHGEPHDCLACVQRRCVERIEPVAGAGRTATLANEAPSALERWFGAGRDADAQARDWAAALGPQVDALVVPIEYLAALQRCGALGGRRVTVVVTRLPLALQRGRGEPIAPRAAAEQAALHGAQRLVAACPELAAKLRRHFSAPVDLQPDGAAILAPQR
jgi:VanW like protein